MPGIAIVGAGTMGRAHAAAWAALGLGAEIRYVCSPRAAHLPDAPAARSTTDLDEVLRDPAVALLSVCTPTDTHFDLASRALAAGKHVLLEKPIASTVREAVRLRDLATPGPAILMVAQVVRFFPGYEAVLDVVLTGAIGAPHTVWAGRLAPTGERPAWMADERRSGGPLVDFAVHDFDQANLLLGVPVAVRATRVGAAAFDTTVEYRGGGRAHVLSSMSLPQGFPFSTSLEVVGDRGLVAYSFSARDGGADGRSDLAVVDPGGARRSVVDPGDPFVAQARYFLSCIESGRPPERSDAASAGVALQVSLGARRSLETGRRVELAPVGVG